MADTEKNLVIFDTDPGIDDAMALLFLKSQPSLKLAAITTVFGNAETDVTTRNALYLAQRFGLDVPVYAGATQPLTIARRPAPTFIHGTMDLVTLVSPKAFPRPLPRVTRPTGSSKSSGPIPAR